MSMEKPLILLNELVDAGVIGEYAIGGAIGATFYIEAVNTQDLDVFVVMTPQPGGLLLLSELYKAATERGASIKGEHLIVGDWPVQILPPPNPLVEEALPQAISTTFSGVPTKVLTAEYLCAIALMTGRIKDFNRVAMFIEQNAVNLDSLRELVIKYNLSHATAKVQNWPRL
jgi:hypothetical protein